jgi:uncharacterized HAD superfamily protein
MIEDFDRNLLGCARVCKKVLLFDQPWNKNTKLPENAVRVKNWEEALKEIK